jgi:hypothetical protein
MPGLHSEVKKLGKTLTENSRSRVAIVSLLIVVFFLALILGIFAESFSKSVPIVLLSEVSSMDSCAQQNTNIFDVNKSDSTVGKAVALLNLQAACYHKGYKQAELNEFQIRRMQFIEQYYDERILLWMVVSITISGVLLAGLQLAASYQLSLSGQSALAQSSELSVQHSKVVLRSSANVPN